MSSSRKIVVAINEITGEIRLPLENTTMYGIGEEDSVRDTCAMGLSSDWSITVYSREGDTVTGRMSSGD